MPAMTTSLALANQKGGVAKTTSVATIAAALVDLGLEVLVVDLDPQSSLTFSLGVDPEDLDVALQDVLAGTARASEAVLTTAEGVDLLPATMGLARLEAAPGALAAGAASGAGVAVTLRDALASLSEDGLSYDWIILDCPPALGALTVAGLSVADGVLVPLQCETLAHRGVGQLLDTVHDVREHLNAGLEVWGVLPTMFDARTTHARGVLESITSGYDLEVLGTPVPKTVKFAEAPAAGLTVLRTARTSKGAQAYRDVAAALVKRSGESAPR